MLKNRILWSLIYLFCFTNHQLCSAQSEEIIYKTALQELEGLVTEKDTVNAISLLYNSGHKGIKKLEELSNIEGSNYLHIVDFYLGEYYKYCVPQDWAKAEYHYKKACSKGSVLSKLALGKLYFDIDIKNYSSLDENLNLRDSINATLDRNEYDNCIYWFNEGLYNGESTYETDNDVYWYLYWAYLNIKDYEDAALNLEIYLKKGDLINVALEDSLRLADAYEMVNPGKAFEIYKYCYNEFKRDNDEYFLPWATCGLALCYYYGRGTKKDYSKAVKLFSEIANLKNPDDGYGNVAEAARYLSICYKYGRGVSADQRKSYYWHERALKNKVKNSMKLQEIIDEKDLKKYRFEW